MSQERRLLLALGLSMLVLMLWWGVFAPPPPEPVEETAPVAGQPGAAPDEPRREEIGAEPAAEAEVETAYQAVGADEEQQLDFRSDLVHVRLSNRGGRVLSWRLNEHTTVDGQPLELLPAFEGDPQWFPLAVALGDPALAREINQALYEVRRETLDDGERIEFAWADGRGLEVTKALTFYDRDASDMLRPHLIEIDLEVTDRGRPLPVGLVFGPGFGVQDPAASNTNYYYWGQVVWNRAGTVSRQYRHKVDDGMKVGNLRWAGLEDQYFVALLLPQGTPAAMEVLVEKLVPGPAVVEAPPPVSAQPGAGEAGPPAASSAEPEAVATVAVTVPPEGVLLYVGAKKYELLRSLGHELEKVVWFSSNGFLAAVSKFVFLALLWVHEHTIHNYGMAIILTTLVLRILLFPLNQYSMVKIKKSQVQMQKLQPKMNSIRNRYKKQKDAQSRAKMNQEIMELYRKEGVNPMGGLTGCLPMLAQFPILIGFYNMLTVAVELRHAPAPFFAWWINDLSVADPYWITPLLMGATMFLQQKMALTKVTDPMQRQQQRFMMLMPVFFTVICIQMPSGLVLYWFTNNVLAIGQQWLVNRRTEQLEAAEQKA